MYDVLFLNVWKWDPWCDMHKLFSLDLEAYPTCESITVTDGSTVPIPADATVLTWIWRPTTVEPTLALFAWQSKVTLTAIVIGEVLTITWKYIWSKTQNCCKTVVIWLTETTYINFNMKLQSFPETPCLMFFSEILLIFFDSGWRCYNTLTCMHI